ncbi:MAG: hypothetical protein J6X35_04020, partial [Bacteroidales bacterium]|nr:hypothetical protein [Bacteroidales bacterium]
HLRFEEITFEGSLVGVELNGIMEDILFRHCNIFTDSNTSSESCHAVRYPDHTGSDIYLKDVRFVSNTIWGGYDNFNLNYTANFGNCLKIAAVTIDSNIMGGAYQYAIQSNGYGHYKSISHNTITNGSHAQKFYGLYFEYEHNNDLINGNIIRLNNPSTSYGMLCYYNSYNYQFHIQGTISNNEIIINGNGTKYGIQLYAPTYNVVNNSIYVKSNATSYALHVYNYDKCPTNILNNNLINDDTIGYALYYSYSPSYTTSYGVRDYNNYYSKSGNHAYLNGTAKTTLSAITALDSTQDQHSVLNQPQWTNSDSLSPSNLQVRNPKQFACPLAYDVKQDILGYLRTDNTSMGCYGFDPDPNDAHLIGFTDMGDNSSNGSHPVRIIIYNAGICPIDSAVISLTINGVLQKPFPYRPEMPLQKMQYDTVTIDTLSFQQGRLSMRAVVSMKGDTNHANDTIIYKMLVCGPNGTASVFTIGDSPSADYSIADFTRMISELSQCKVNGDIILQFEDGKYTTDSLDLTLFDSIMNGYRLTVTSKSEDRNKVTISNTSGNLFVLGGNKKLVIRNLTLEAPNGNVIHFKSSCDSIDILHNHLLSPKIGSSYSFFPICKSNSNDSIHGLRIIGNDIEGGFYGICLYGSDKAYNKGVVIDSNHIFNQYIIAINLSKNQCISISHNKLHPHTSQSAVSWCGLRLNGDIASEINGNDIDATIGSNVTSPYPFYAENLNRNVQYQAIISNNIINCYTNFSNTYSIYANKGRADFCHNTIVMGGTGKGYAICCRPESRNYTINFWGNLIVTSKNQEILSMTYSYNNSLDYNNYYNEGERFGNCNSSIISNLATCQKATGRDAHSTSLPVEFLDTNNCLKLKKYEMFLIPKLQKVDTDFDGVKRENLTTMGAYTHAFQPLDAALTDFAKTNFNNPSKTHIEVTLSNYGKDTLTSAIIGWSLDNVQQTPVKWSGNLPQFGSISVTLADMAQANFKKTEITAWVSNPNGKNDMYPSNDTVNLDTFICNGQMAGIYTVGGAHPDFANLDEAFLALNTCGVNAPVTLKLRSTSLNGMTITGSVPGSSNTRLITLMPDSNAKVVIDKPNGTALTIKKAAHWKFQGLTIGNDSNGMIGVTLIDSLQDIHFLNCNICANKTTSNTSSRAISMDESVTKSNYLDNVSFIGNNIKGGYYGIYIYETKNAAPNGVTIDSNNISEACCYGIYNYIGCHYKSISYNRITNRKRSSYYFNGIYAEWNSHIESIEGNRIFVQNVNGCCGIYLGNNIKTFSGKTGLLKNNEVILLSSRDYGFENYTVYGIHLYSLNHNWEIANNSILTKGDRAEVCGLNTYNSQNYKLDIKNNHFVSQGPSNYPIYLGDRYTNNYVNLDYNNYVSLSGSTIGYAGSAKSSLSSWQSATGMDTHSVSMRPIYIDSTINLQIMNNEFFICPRINTVPIDINGTSRSQITIIGCYSMKISENLQAIQFVTPQPIKDVVCYADYTPISIEVKNAGLKEADFSISPLKVSLDITGAISLHSDTLITSGTIGYRQTDTISLGSIPTINGGIYNIKVTLADTSDTLPEDDTLSLIYNASRVELPYDIDFSTEPDEFVNVTMFGNTGWEVVKGTGSNPTISPVFGTGRLEFAGANNPGSNANAIFNAVNIQNCINPMLSFWYAHSANCTGNDMLIVMATTDGGANYTELKRIKLADTATAWKQYDIDLNAFTKSSCLSIVFRAISYGGANQSIDRIRITASQDAELSLLPINISERSVCDNTPVDVKAVITNLSRLNIDMSNDTLTLNVTGAVNYSNKIIYNHRLGDFESDTVTLGQISLDANGAYYFEAFMQSFDNRNSNDTVTDSTLFIWQDIALDTLFGLDGQMFKKTGDTVHVSTLAVNNGNIPVEMVLLRLSIDGKEVVTDTIRKHLNAGDTVRHTMSKCYTVPAVSKDQPYYFFELKTELACDADNTNNAISIVGQVDIPDTIDIQVLEAATTAQALGKTKLAPSDRVANIGNMAVENVLLHVDV